MDEPPELPELVDFEVPSNGHINTMDTPLVQPRTEVSNYVDNSVAIHSCGSFELTAAEAEAFREEVEALLQSVQCFQFP